MADAAIGFFAEISESVFYQAVAGAQYTDEGRRVQIGVIDIQVRIIDLILSNSNYRAPEQMRDAAHRIFDLVAATHRLLHGWTGGRHYGPLTRNSVVKINRRDVLKEYRLRYRVQLTDADAAEEWQYVKVNLIGIYLVIKLFFVSLW
jgi:hypothetical protein